MKSLTIKVFIVFIAVSIFAAIAITIIVKNRNTQRNNYQSTVGSEFESGSNAASVSESKSGLSSDSEKMSEKASETEIETSGESAETSDGNSELKKETGSSEDSENCNESSETSECEDVSEAEQDSESESEFVHIHNFKKNIKNEFLKSEATCLEKAVYFLSCDCGAKSERTFEYGNYASHKEEIDPAVEPTKKDSGLTEGKHCSVCKDILIKQEIIPAIGSIGLEYKLNSDGLTYTVKGVGTCTDNEVVIPTVHRDGRLIIAIGGYAFLDCTNITSVIIEYGITSIGVRAFDGCNALQTIEIPDSITKIGNYVFDNCGKLQYNEYDNAYYLGNNDNKFFALILAKNYEILSCEINEKTVVITGCAFSNCEKLSSISIPENVITIGDAAFFCSGITDIVIPESVATIGDQAFCCCSKLTNIIIPDSVIFIGQGAFSDCDNLQYTEYGNAYYLGNNENKFFALIKAKSEDIYYCEINDRTKIIVGGAFYNCQWISEIKIPDSVIYIGIGLIEYCSRLEKIEVAPGNNYYYSENNYIIEKTTKTLVVGYKDFGIPNDVSCIGEASFSCSLVITNIVIPDGITYIKNYAFSGCSNIRSITIPKSITSIGVCAFQYCTALTSIEYKGTKEEWLSITKGTNWNKNTGKYIVHCSDGNMTKE